ncbi:MAG: 2-oxoglutarate dehydrogenase complex dihydrolipoyllysine-residue succinyltransferase [Bacteroidales bacterium]|nr:2-oxoglutarate dehydrogenase complex dihydrolipoyllysine-residue succinyltransferase [Bacteroidales bacterium]
MLIEVKVPSPGESITEVQLVNWLVKDGDYVEKDAELAEIDSDKATLTANAEAAGKIQILVEAGETIAVGSVVARIDTDAVGSAPVKPVTVKEVEAAPKEPQVKQEVTRSTEVKPTESKPAQVEFAEKSLHLSPLARKMMEEKNLSENEIIEHIRITRRDIMDVAEKKAIIPQNVPQPSWGGTREQDRKKMTTLRVKLGKRLVSVKNETAMLTTFNEVNMSNIMGLKKQFNDTFKEKYGVGIGFMSFFTKAVTQALGHFPQVNAMIEGDELIYSKYADIGIAVSAPKGLVVPVIRNAETLTLAEIELKIKELATKARENKISLDEMSGGTFTITNGGVFGSMMSTPILNPPQSAILGMHNIIERPIAQNGQVVIAPMMYIALSYDHRVIDGRESVSFLVKVKELLENPVKMLFEGNDPVKVLLGI